MPTSLGRLTTLAGYGRIRQPASSGPSGPLRVLMLGDANRDTLITSLNTARTALGYTGVTITWTSTDSNNYAGTNLTTANYDVVVIYTNGSAVPASAGGTALNNYIASGGKVVFLTFCWGNVSAIPSFTYTNNPYVYNGSSATGFVPTLTVVGTHPITTGLGTTMGTSVFRTSNIVLQGNATNLGWYPDGTTSMIAVQESPRRVGINFYPVSGVTSNGYQLILKSIVWAGGLLN
jgi:hypothetical protein